MTKKKSSAKEPFLPLFFGDFLGATGEWDGEERALYLLLLGHQWTIGSLPADLNKLRKLADYQQTNFDRWWPRVSEKFEAQGDRLVNRRLELHRNKTREVAGKNAESGKKGARARWAKDGERHPESWRTPSNDMANAIEKEKSAIAERHQKSDGAVNGNPSHPIPSHPIEEETSSVHAPSESKDPTDSHTHTNRNRTGRAPEWDYRGPLQSPDQSAEFKAAFRNYPGPPSNNPVGDQAAALALVSSRSATWDGLRAGVDRYRRYVDGGGVSGPRFVLSIKSFCSPRDKRWEQAWELPTASTGESQDFIGDLTDEDFADGPH